MYFPYLHAKQKEVLALRHLAPTLAQDGRVQPVIEPVRHLATSLRHTLDITEASGQPVWLIVNPVQEDFAGQPAQQTMEWGRSLFISLPKRQHVHPALMLGPTLTPEIARRFITTFGPRPLALVVGTDSPPLADVMAEIPTEHIRYVFFKGDEPTPSVRAAARTAGCVWVQQPRQPDPKALRADDCHLFGDHHLHYAERGYAGFSDYTTLPSIPSPTSSLSRSVAFRLSYIHRGLQAAGSIWLEHFSAIDPAETTRNADGRFRSALQRFRSAFDRPQVCFGPTEAVRRYLTSLIDNAPPSRSLSKQWEVMHHLELVSGMLAGRFPAR